jgi:hypothetical protein
VTVRPLLIDLSIGELVLPAAIDALPDTGVDHGVVPFAMVEYLRRADSFPIAPAIAWKGSRFVVVGGAKCVWAGSVAGWSQPVQCILMADPDALPDSVRARTEPFSEARALARLPPPSSAGDLQVLCFERALSAGEQAEVERALRVAAEAAARARSPNFSRVDAARWEGPSIFMWRTPVSKNPEDRTFARQFSECLQAIEGKGMRIAALNGRRYWGQDVTPPLTPP